MEGIESFCQNFVKCYQSGRIVAFQECIDQREAVLIVEDIEVAEHILVFHVRAAERHRLVEDGEGVTHGSVCLVGNHMERLVIDGHTLAGSHHTEVLHDIVDRDPVEIVGLAARKNSRQDLMFLCSGKDEDRMCRRFLQCLEECIECGLRQHMYLVDDVYAVFSHLRRYAHLIHQCLDVLDAVVRSGIEFMDAV